MKKVVSRSLFIANSILVVLLVLLSCIMLLTANSPSQSIWGYSLRLANGLAVDETIGSRCLVVAKPGDTALAQGDYFLRNTDGVLSIYTAQRVENNRVSCVDAITLEPVEIDLTSPEYGGRITYTNNFWGGILSAVSSKDNVSLSYILIVGIFLLSLLSLAVVYVGQLNRTRRAEVNEMWKTAVSSVNLHAEPPEETKAEEEEEEVELFLEVPPEQSPESEPVVEQEVIPTLDSETIRQELAELEAQFPPYALTPSKKEPVSQLPPVVHPETNLPLARYYLLNDDVPSIHSLMESIDEQFKTTTRSANRNESTKETQSL